MMVTRDSASVFVILATEDRLQALSARDGSLPKSRTVAPGVVVDVDEQGTVCAVRVKDREAMHATVSDTAGTSGGCVVTLRETPYTESVWPYPGVEVARDAAGALARVFVRRSVVFDD